MQQPDILAGPDGVPSDVRRPDRLANRRTIQRPAVQRGTDGCPSERRPHR